MSRQSKVVHQTSHLRSSSCGKQQPSKGDDLSNLQDPLGAARTLLVQGRASVQAEPLEAYQAVRSAVAILPSAYAKKDEIIKSGLNPSPNIE
jgi:hypothetical protein